MSLYGFDAPQEEDSAVIMINWQMVEMPDGKHIVGTDASWRDGRVSTAVVTYDESTQRAITKSGRVYQLEGEPTGELSSNANFVLQQYLRINGFDKPSDPEVN